MDHRLSLALAAAALTLAACQGDGGDDTGDTPSIPEDNLRYVLGDCDGEKREPDAYPNQLGPGNELERATLAAPEAVCNDGSPAVVYVRPYSDPDLAGTWSLHLQGGGACGNYVECALRWCGTAYYDSSKMSSEGLPPTIGAVGIYDSDPANVLAGANQVYFYYCSSDSWTGQGTATYAGPEGEDLPAYSAYRHGHLILEAAVEALEAGLTTDLGTELPSLAEAERVVLSGTSAGSVGAQHNADWFSERLSAPVVGIFDAAHTPPPDYWPADMRDGLVDLLQKGWDLRVAQSDATPFLDTSCLAAVDEADLWQCNTTAYVLRLYVTTPFFARQDLRDIGGLAEGLGIEEDEHEAMMRAYLLDLAQARTTWPEGETLDVDPGVYGPNCKQHVALETNPWWRVATVLDDTTPRTFQAAAGRWWQGQDVAIVDDAVVGPGNGPRSDCATVDDEH